MTAGSSAKIVALKSSIVSEFAFGLGNCSFPELSDDVNAYVASPRYTNGLGDGAKADLLR